MNFNKHTVTPTFATSFIFDNFIPTYHSLHVCSCQALLCARLAACKLRNVFEYRQCKVTLACLWVRREEKAFRGRG